MEKKLSVAVIILTKDEERHIERCVRNVLQISDEVYVVDSESTDRTCEIAERFGATVVEHPWPGNQAEQCNWALDNLPVRAEWILRLDADEYLLPELVEELREKLPAMPEDVSALSLSLARCFCGRVLRHGIVNNINEIEGVFIGILAEEQDSGTKFSLRAANGANVAQLAQKFGGGGHVAAAGISINGEALDAAFDKVIAAAEAYAREL